MCVCVCVCEVVPVLTAGMQGGAQIVPQLSLHDTGRDVTRIPMNTFCREAWKKTDGKIKTRRESSTRSPALPHLSRPF